MQILTRTECGRCDGTGVVMHPEWKKFWIENPDARGMDELQLAAFFGCSPDQIPPEEEACDLCGGTGWVERWVRAEELFRTQHVPPGSVPRAAGEVS